MSAKGEGRDGRDRPTERDGFCKIIAKAGMSETRPGERTGLANQRARVGRLGKGGS